MLCNICLCYIIYVIILYIYIIILYVENIGCGLYSRWVIKTSDNDVVLVSLMLALSVFCV